MGMMKPATVDRRKRDLASIHLMATQLGMDTAEKSTSSDYRQMLRSVAGAYSASELDARGRFRVIAHLRACLGKPVKRTAQAIGGGGSQQDLIEQLWAELAAAGVVRSAAPEALAAFVQRVAGVGHPRWLTAASGSKVIEALKAMRKRGGC